MTDDRPREVLAPEYGRGIIRSLVVTEEIQLPASASSGINWADSYTVPYQLARHNAPYTDWNPFGTDAPAQVIRVQPHDDGSILYGMSPGSPLGVAARGTVRVLHNIGGTNTQNSGNLILGQDKAGNTYPFHLVGRKPYEVIPSLGMAILRLDETDKWFVVAVEGVRDYVRSALVPIVAGTTDLIDWDPVDSATGLSFRFCNTMIVDPAGVGVVINSLVMEGGPGASPPGSAYGQPFRLLNVGAGLTIKHLGAGTPTSGTTFRCPGGVDYVVPNLGAVRFWYDDSNHVFWVDDARIGGQ